ncbi:RWD domain-containing protein 2A [Condylostylus longicornis]|uniref:RWD domain-containing protein 2A n=1 Tax=Condylostylus longicornis TaxID=2530218 RepID=UPI00244E586E|nr:RWD domain-containing protein 2A [Condylostylus longicornis]XP_055372409.1 RWD domain-containing protein 2A [Condylostylus longicornis]
MGDFSKDQLRIYKECLQKQLEEIDMLSSIFCNPGEIQIYDHSVISEFHEFINNESTTSYPKMQLDFSIYVQNEMKQKIEIHISLPNLYPILENAVVTIRATFSNKSKEIAVKNEIAKYINSNDVDRNEPYIYQVITWIQDSLERFLSDEIIWDENNSLIISVDNRTSSSSTLYSSNDNSKISNNNVSTTNTAHNNSIEFERLWIVSHHIKSKTKRTEIVRNAKDLNLTGFSKPGKPGIICVEGNKENTQEYWKIIKSMNWHKIQIKISEVKKRNNQEDLDKCRRFNGFKEELVTEIEDEGFAPMNMSLFMKFLESHKSGYIKKELFGFD